MVEIKQDLDFLNRVGESAWVVDQDQMIVFWNEKAEEVFGYKAVEVLGLPCYEVFKCRSGEGLPLHSSPCRIGQRIQNGKPVGASNLILRHHDGYDLKASVSTLPLPLAPTRMVVPSILHLARVQEMIQPNPGMLRVYLLGNTTVWRADGSIIEGGFWNRAKVRALFAYLMSVRGRAVHRDELIDTFWRDLEYHAALENLNTTIYNLRKSLEPSLRQGTSSKYIHYAHDYYSISGFERHWLDIVHFEDGIMRARRNPNKLVATREYQDALGLYRGDFLNDVVYASPWASHEQQRLRSLYLDAMEELGELLEKQELFQRATDIYSYLISLDACREAVAQHLMEYALREKNRTFAISVFLRLETALKTTLDVAPNEKTQILYMKARLLETA